MSQETCWFCTSTSISFWKIFYVSTITKILDVLLQMQSRISNLNAYTTHPKTYIIFFIALNFKGNMKSHNTISTPNHYSPLAINDYIFSLPWRANAYNFNFQVMIMLSVIIIKLNSNLPLWNLMLVTNICKDLDVNYKSYHLSVWFYCINDQRFQIKIICHLCLDIIQPLYYICVRFFAGPFQI